VARGFGELVAIVAVFPHGVLTRRLSNTMTTDFCLKAMEQALVPVWQLPDL
jgi:hypothetical protein